MVLFFLFMQASLSAQVSWNLMLHLLGAACAVGSSGFTLSTLGRTAQAHWLVLQAGLSSDRTPPTPIQPHSKATPTQVLLFHTSAELPWSQAGGPCVSLGGGWSLREESCALKDPGCHWGCRGAPAWAACP